MQDRLEQRSIVNIGHNNVLKLSENDNNSDVSSVTKGMADNCNFKNVYHNDCGCILILKPYASVSYAGKSIMYYYLQYTTADADYNLVDPAVGHNIHSMGHMGDMLDINEAGSVSKITANTINSPSQDGCQLSERVRAMNIGVDDAEMPDIDSIYGVKLMSVMNLCQIRRQLY